MTITDTFDADVEAAWNAKPDYQTACDARMVTTAVNTIRKIAVEHFPSAVLMEIIDVDDLRLAPSRILDADQTVLWTATVSDPLYTVLLACVSTIDRFSASPRLTVSLV